jgi:DNA processing protein
MSRPCSPIAEKYLRLHLCEDVGSIRFANLLSELGGIDAVLSAPLAQLTRVDKVGEKTARNIVRDRDSSLAQEEVQIAGDEGVRILCIEDDEYPVALKNISDPPACLYVRGTLQREDALALGIVGSRTCSRYGAEQSERLAGLAAGAGLTIVSGMARGIDTYAHRGALAARGRTIAVLGCGLCHIYPEESADLAARIAANGAIVSALPMRISPDAKNFPPRNRIIAGLSLGVLVVEAAKRSGALITARLASEYNREVFALPGRVDGPLAEGCHQLIKTGGAKLVTCLPDILDELGAVGQTLSVRDESAIGPVLQQASLDATELRILSAMGTEAVGAEALIELSDLPAAKVASLLTGLQLKGAVRRVGSDLYERVSRG